MYMYIFLSPFVPPYTKKHYTMYLIKILLDDREDILFVKILWE